MSKKIAWEWEDGDGFTVLGTWEPLLAFHLILEELDMIFGQDIEDEYVPEFSRVIHGERMWHDMKELDNDVWNPRKRWWFGRRKILLVTY